MPSIHDVFDDLEGSTIRITFADGDELLLDIIDCSHARLNDTVWGFPTGAAPTEAGVQFDLPDVVRVEKLSGRLLFDRGNLNHDSS